MPHRPTNVKRVLQNILQNPPNSPRLARRARIHNSIAHSNHFLRNTFCALAPWPACCYLLSAMNTATSFITVDITALSHDGRGIARLAPTEGEGRGAVVFVAHALPGQRVVARVTRRKASFMEAELHELVRQASNVASPICPHHAECGGCPLQTMPYEQQLFWKRTIVLD